LTTEDIFIQIFSLVDDALKNMPMHTKAKLHPSARVKIGILFALPGWLFPRVLLLAGTRLC